MILPLQKHSVPPSTNSPRISQKTLFFTIGYEQTEPSKFLNLLRSFQVDLVVDVRQMPLSRKKGFSKNQLRTLLDERGIEYVHVQTLGAPKQIRDRLRENGSWYEYVKGYEKVLSQRTQDVMLLVEQAKERRICLLCFERKAEECHRSLVAREMEKHGNDSNLTVEHIRY
jgi:uncharacterized protein (DUF488 family)